MYADTYNQRNYAVFHTTVLLMLNKVLQLLEMQCQHILQSELWSLYMWCVSRTFCRWYSESFKQVCLNSEMDNDSVVDTANEEQMDECCESCTHHFINTVPVTCEIEGLCTAECDSGDWSTEVKLEHLPNVKQESDDVCYVAYIFISAVSVTVSKPKLGFFIQNRSETETSKFCRLTSGFISHIPQTVIRLCQHISTAPIKRRNGI